MKIFKRVKQISVAKLIEEKEKIYPGDNHPIKYMFLPEEKSTYLIVVLSGFSGREAYRENAKFNYIKTLLNIKCNKLYIMDEVNNIPTYYYGTDSKSNYLEDCTKLIKETMNTYGIQEESLIIAGSSKGGTGAILIGNELGAGHIIAGAPQYFPLDYLNEINEEARNLILNNILHDDEDFEDVQKQMKEKMLNLDSNTKLYLHAGNQDLHYVKHLRPYMSMLTKRKKLYALDLQHYEGHQNLKYKFPKFLVRTVSEITSTEN
ncbi:accessory Sec system protein Asp2 [Macrococcus equi]|uniref:accessory Sec system protein Asp2 n=1 Tax=Macrococcus equi TaxID=3395462 RepID=UPI0039BDC896